VAKHIGIVACSAPGAALCYRTLCDEAPQQMGPHQHPEITLHNHPLGRYMPAIRAGDWDAVAALMLDSAGRLARAGAELAICPDNTIHAAFEKVEPRSPIPWLHIARVVGAEARRRGFRRLGILGTRSLMEGPVYPHALEPLGIEPLQPTAGQREQIDRMIFDELVAGVFRDETRAAFHEIIEMLRDRGADAAVLGCTEIPLIVDPATAALPTLDSTRLLARAALATALA